MDRPFEGRGGVYFTIIYIIYISQSLRARTCTINRAGGQEQQRLVESQKKWFDEASYDSHSME